MATALLVMAAGCTKKSEKDIASHVIVIGLDHKGHAHGQGSPELARYSDRCF